MLHAASIEGIPERFNSPYIKPEEVYFDTLVSQNRISEASGYIGDYVNELAHENEAVIYSSRFFRASLKEIALPMYRKNYADYKGRQYPESRTEIPAMYDNARQLLAHMQALRDHWTIDAPHEVSDETYEDLRGDMSELTVFALATRGMVGVEDDVTITPSSAIEDSGDVFADGIHTGFDFMVYDRDRNQQYPLQVKTSAVSTEYHPLIAILTLRDFCKEFDISVEDLQRAIVADDGSNELARDAAELMQHHLRTALEPVEAEIELYQQAS